jgi:hypothetical protein
MVKEAQMPHRAVSAETMEKLFAEALARTG